MIEWKKQGETWTVYQRFYLDGRQKQPGNLWTTIEGNKKATRQIRALFDSKKVFETAKPLELLTKLISLSCEPDDYIVDFFSGSATTAHAAMQLNSTDKGTRKFILVQWAEAVREGSEAARAGFTTIDEIGIERIKRASKAIREASPLTTTDLDLGFKHYTLAEPSQNVLDKLEKFEPDNNTFIASGLLSEFGKTTVLATWLNRDGYGLTNAPEEIEFNDYKGYYISKHLYLIDEHLSNGAIEAILTKLETDGSFNPENVVLFGYSFLWTEREALQTNLKRLKDAEKNLRINLDIRY
jgi:type III restriction enzyme/adenine-specific DNA-methyltransferase